MARNKQQLVMNPLPLGYMAVKLTAELLCSAQRWSWLEPRQILIYPIFRLLVAWYEHSCNNMGSSSNFYHSAMTKKHVAKLLKRKQSQFLNQVFDLVPRNQIRIVWQPRQHTDLPWQKKFCGFSSRDRCADMETLFSCPAPGFEPMRLFTTKQHQNTWLMRRLVGQMLTKKQFL